MAAWRLRNLTAAEPDGSVADAAGGDADAAGSDVDAGGWTGSSDPPADDT